MYKKIIAATICLLTCLPANVQATMDDMLDTGLSRSLAKMEQLYASGKWDEAMEVGRGILKDAPKNHKAAYRAQDLIVLSLEGKNQEILRRQKREAKERCIEVAKNLLTSANKLLEQKNYKEAASKFSQSIKLNGGDAQTYYLLGYSLLKSGNDNKAYEALKKSLQLNPNHEKALFHIAGLSYNLKKGEDAEFYTAKLINVLETKLDEYKDIFQSQRAGKMESKAYDTAGKINSLKSNLAQAAIMNGRLAQDKGDYKTAEKSFLKASKLRPEDADVWYRLGTCYLQNKVYHQSSIAFEQSVFIREAKLKDMSNEAKHLLDEGQNDKAVEAELRTRKFKEQLANSYYMLSVANSKKNEIRAAIRYIDKALEVNPDFMQGKYTKALLLSANNQLNEALDEMREVLQKSEPNSKDAERAISTITSLMDKISKRDNPTDQVIKTTPPNVMEVNEYVKDMPGLDGKNLEITLEEVFPKLREIKKLVDMRNYAEASRRLIYLKGRHPEIAELHALLGACYNEMGRLSEAETCYKKTIEIQNNHTEALNGLANIWAGRGEKLDKALDYVNQALKIDENRAEFWHTHGLVLFKKGELQQAIESYKKALAIKPNYMLVRYNLGLSYYLVQGYQAAIDSFDAVLALNPTHQKALLFKSICLAKNKQNDEALSVINTLKGTLEPKSSLAKVVKDFENKIISARDKNDIAEIPEIKSPVNIDRLLAEARDLRNKNLVTRAKEKYLECQRLDPKRYEPYSELGQMYADSGLYKAAQTAWEKAAELAPANYDLRMNIGKMQHKLGQLTMAQKTFEMASKINPKDAEPLYYIGMIAYEAKNFETALVYAKDALKLKNNYLKAMALQGMSLVRLDRLKEAKTVYEKLYAKAPNNSSIKHHARVKIWEITKALTPEAFPSYDNVMTAKAEMENKVGGVNISSDGNAEVKTLPAITISPSEEELLAEYGKNTMTPNDKEWVLKQFGRMGNEKMSKISSSSSSNVKTITENEKLRLTNKMKGFGNHANRFALPDEVADEKKTVASIEETHIRVSDISDEMTKQAIDSMSKGFVMQAAEEFRKATALSPNNLDVLLNNGYFNTLQGNFKDAFDAFAQATIKHPDNNLARLGLGNLYWLGGQGEKAVEQWKMIKGKFFINDDFSAMKQAEKVWNRMLEIDPLDVDAHSNLGVVYMFSGKPKEAITEFETVNSLEQNRYEHDYYRAQMNILLYIMTKNKDNKKEAEKLLTNISKKTESFPHSTELKKYIAKL